MAGLFAQPAPHVGGFGFGVVEPAVEQRCRTRAGIPGIKQHGARIDLPEPGPQGLDIALVGQIGLGQDDTVCDRRLLHRLDMAIECRIAVDRVDQRDDAVEPESLDKGWMRHEPPTPRFN